MLRPAVALQIDATTQQHDAFRCEFRALSLVRITTDWEGNASAGVDHPEPGQPRRGRRLPEYGAYQSRPPRQAGEVGDSTVGADATARNTRYRGENALGIGWDRCGSGRSLWRFSRVRFLVHQRCCFDRLLQSHDDRRKSRATSGLNQWPGAHLASSQIGTRSWTVSCARSARSGWWRRSPPVSAMPSAATKGSARSSMSPGESGNQ